MSEDVKEKPISLMYFTNEIKAQLSYVKALEKKIEDVNREHTERVEGLIDKYKDGKTEFEQADFAVIFQLNMIFQSILSDIQVSIVKMVYCKQIAMTLLGFTFEELKLDDDEREAFLALEAGNQHVLFELTEKGDLKMKDDLLYETIRDRSFSGTPKDQKSLREIYAKYYTNYMSEKKAREDEEERKERYRRQLEEKLKHEEEIKNIHDGKEANTEEPESPQG